MALRRTQKLFVLNAICIDLLPERIICLDPLKMTEPRSDFDVMLEAYRGLSRIIEPAVALFPYIPGPGNLSRAIFNLLAFYELAVLLIRQAPPDEEAALSGIEELRPTAIIFQSDRTTLPKNPAYTGFTGQALSQKLLTSGNDVALRTISDMLEHGVAVITTAGEVSSNMEPRTIHVLS